MSRVTTSSPEAEAYLAAVRDELGHLSEEERGDLLEDLALHLAEVADDDAREEPVGLVARLGAPAEYAAELRAAAGLPARPDARPARPSGGSEGLLAALVRSPAGRLARAAWHHRWARGTRGFLRELTPAWWVLRAYLVVAVLAWRSPDGGDFPIPAVTSNPILSLAAIVAAVAGSIALGRRTKGPGARALVVVVDVVIVLAALAVTADLDARMSSVRSVPFPLQAVGYELTSPSGPVTNIYPYSRDGQPLADVLLFDQDGRPLRAAAQQWWPDGCPRAASHPRAVDGVGVEFAFPLQYGLLPGVRADRCMATVARPPVPLPTFPGGPGQAPPDQSPAG